MPDHKMEGSTSNNQSFIGTIEQFTPGDNFSEYVERMEYLFTINDVPEAKQVPLFLTMVGPDSYKKIKDIVAPQNPKDKKFAELIEKIKDDFTEKKNIIAERFKFNSCMQKVNQSISEYILELKTLSVNCNFGSFLADALRDKLVQGLLDEKLQKNLLRTENLVWETACAKAKESEVVDKGQQKMKISSATGIINKVNSDQKAKFVRNCGKCGKDHVPNNCIAKFWQCFICGVTGHSAKMCRRKNDVTNSKKFNNKNQYSGKKYNNSKSVKRINNVKQINNPVILQTKINDNVVEMEVDSGAALSVINYSDYVKYFSKIKLNDCKKR